MLTEKRLREIETLLEANSYRKDFWLLGVNLILLIPMLTVEIRRQQAQIKKLKRKVETLEEALR